MNNIRIMNIEQDNGQVYLRGGVLQFSCGGTCEAISVL